MRKALFLAAMILLSVGKLYAVAPPIDSFYQQGAKWAIARYNLGSQGRPDTYYGHLYTIGNDSSIGAYTYHLVYYNDNLGIPAGLLGGIRIDSAKVYFIYLRSDTLYVRGNYAPALTFAFFASGSEHQLYDYGVHVGDTVKWKCPTNNIVKKIDSIKVRFVPAIEFTYASALNE